MNQSRINSIKKTFEGVGPVKGMEYTNQEIVDLLMGVQKTMFTGVYEKTHAEFMKERDLLMHFSSLAEEYGLKETETYQRFEKNMSDLGYTIGSFIKGMKGEKIAKRALKLISYDKDVKILYNIALEDEDAQAEYDAIVITPYGLFVVEVKNWGAEMHIDENGILQRIDQDIKYDLPGRMSIKEGLLKEYVGDLFPDKYQGIVLFSNENAKVQDDYKKMPICYGGGIVYTIRDYKSNGNVLTSEQISVIEKRIVSSHKEQKAPCKVNCEELIDDYATLMAAIEEAAEGSLDSVAELANPQQQITKEVEKNVKQVVEKKVANKAVASGEKMVSNTAGSIALGFLVVFGVGVAVAKAFGSHR